MNRDNEHGPQHPHGGSGTQGAAGEISDSSARELPPVPDVPTAALQSPHAEDTKKNKKKKKKKKDKDGLGSSRGIETMFRTSYRTHIDMSSLADSKANIMISINGFIMSILIASISSKVDTNTWLLLPTSFLLLGCLLSMVFAVLAARPRVTARPVTLDDVRHDRANILFFGNFVNMREEDYTQGMTELLQNPDALYLNMIRDIYSLGKVLALKFRYLRISYAVFMGALVVGVTFFVIVLARVVSTTGAGPLGG